MCGIFGISVREDTPLSLNTIRTAVDDLFRFSESRGKEAAGIALLCRDEIRVYKEAVRASTLLRRPEYEHLFADVAGNGSTARHGGLGRPLTVIGHSRLVTTGQQDNRLNNQPVISYGAVGIHNGIVVNDEDLWRAFPSMERRGRVDSEVIVSLIRRHLAEGHDLVASVRRTFELIQGAASIAVLFDDLDAMVLATNTGSLYMSASPQAGAVLFASEEYILRTLLHKRYLERPLGDCAVSQMRPGQGCIIHLRDLSQHHFALGGDPPAAAVLPRTATPRRVVDVEPDAGRRTGSRVPAGAMPPGHAVVKGALPTPNFEAIARLRRCTRCILPETMPMIHFDADGVCNFCHRYRRQKVRGPEALEEILRPHRSTGDRPDCLVGLSGGRDSTYALHIVKTVLKMNPIAFTYDWGMVTDLARRNISRICGKLGVEHILVSADIEKKRRFIRQNVLAWLKRPDLGIIPLFMAGDKQYFYFAKKLRSQINVPVIILGENLLEKTDFKTGFCGVDVDATDPNHAYTLSVGGKLKLAWYYGTAYLRTPAYLNASLFDTLFAYACFYLISRDYLNLYSFIRWDEDTISKTIIGEYDWELASDTDSTWRIGDGTASFYNYIYHTVAGFSENDTFRSNQIREGVLTRAEALARSQKENQPRWETIRWYLETIGLGHDFERIVHRINEIAKLYNV
jgi:glutamine---fructose-6-phosphate transaminase (isomerizing)